MKEYLHAIVSPLLSKPDVLSIIESADNMGVLLTMDVAREDMPHLVGKQGQNILAIRKIVAMYGMRNNAKISIKINEPVGGKYSKP